MSEKKYVVPTGMLRAALAYRDDAKLSQDGKPLHINAAYIECILEAAVRWLAEQEKNVLQETAMVFTVPNAGRYSIGMDAEDSDDAVAVILRIGDDGVDEEVATLRRDKFGNWIQEFPESKVPEAVKDLLWEQIPLKSEFDDPVSLHNTLCLAAYYRGKEGK